MRDSNPHWTGYEPVALTVKLTALIMMKKCCWWLNRQLIAKTKILAMKFIKNRGTSSYLKVDAVGSAGYEPRVLTAELMARILQSTEEPKGARRWIVDESGNCLEKKWIICVESLLCGEAFGSALTFGAVKKASAPGQLGAEELRMVLKILHDVW